jgi:hypothetical protein
MAISKLNFNSINVTPSANAAIGFDSGADDLETGAGGGSMKFIKKLTSDGSDDDLSFVDGSSNVVLDSTYKEYMFILNNIHSESDDITLTVNFRDGGSAYDAPKTTTFFWSYHNEADTATALTYVDGSDVAQGTGAQFLGNLGSDADQSYSGYLHLFNPSSTTFVKHFISTGNWSSSGDFASQSHVAGYCNTTSAIDGVQFKMASDQIQGGTITLYGIS